MLTNYVQLFLLTLLLFVYINNFSEAINCRNFSVKSAQFAVENFHQIPIEGKGNDKIVQNFVASIEQKISESKKAASDQPKKLENIIGDPDTIVNNARKMITLATDACYSLPSKNRNAAYLDCVQYLLYHHMQQLVLRLENKFGVSFGENEEKNAFLKIYTDKKMLAWEQMVKEYGDELAALYEINERINRKFGLCLIIEGETQLKCSAMNVENAEVFVNHFYKIVFEPEFEKNLAKKSELITTYLFNSLRTEQRNSFQNLEGENEQKAKNMAKNWKLAEPSMRVRFQVLVNTAGTKCQQLIKIHYKFFKQIVEEAKGKKKLKQEGINQNDKKDKTKKDIDNKKEQNQNEGEKKDPPMTEDYTKRLDELKNDFALCIYHYMYAFSENLIKKIEGTNGENSYNKKFKDIYKNLRQKTRKRMESVYNSEGLENMDKWLNGEKGPSASSTAKKGEAEDENEEETWEDPFNNCANVVKDHVEDSRLNGGGGLMDKSFDDHLFQCASQFFEAVRRDQFDYKLFVNQHTMQLDTEMKFPSSMNRIQLNNGQNTEDKCLIMRELLMSLNQSLAHRLNYEKITLREEKENLVSLNEKYGKLRLDKMDNKWLLLEIGKKIGQGYEKWRLTNSLGTLTHPIRDQYRIGREFVGEMLEDYGISDTYKKGQEAVVQTINKLNESLGTPKNQKMKTDRKEDDPVKDLEQMGILTEIDRENVAKIKEQRGVFDQIVTRMGKSVEKEMGATFNFKFWEKTSKEKQHGGNESPVNEAEKEIGIGHELKYMGYVRESNGEELLETLKDEMQLNLEQFNMSFDGQCDLTSELSDCFAASDGLDYDAQLEKLSFTGKDKDKLGTIEKAAELLFKKLNRWSYKFGQKEKHQQNFMQRFFTRNLKGIFGLIQKLMTKQESPFELFIPFYRPVKKGIKAVINKVILEPNRKLRAWKEQRRRKRGIGQGAGLTAYEAAGKPGSATIEAMLIDFKLTETSLTTPLPGVQLHWIHFNHAVMLGKYNLAMSFVTCIIMLFTIVSFLYWWYALMLSVRMASNHGEFLGWATISMALAFYILFFLAFVLL
ncbi:hypothetical protein niasHT_029220 [Heterodera trifolii]|uniref:Uncharacterized protein n=1 Tax=Heterodera trifolii TaxID=157864 RepID=A0ABD2JEB7_9BILA